MVFQKHICILLILAMGVFGMALPAWSGTWFDDFGDKKPDGWEIVGGTWKIKDGGYHGKEPTATEGVILIGDEGWGPDYSIEAKVRNAQGAWLALHVRWVDIDNHYEWWIDLANKEGDLYIKRGAYEQKTKDPIPLDLKKGHALIVMERKEGIVFKHKSNILK